MVALRLSEIPEHIAGVAVRLSRRIRTSAHLDEGAWQELTPNRFVNSPRSAWNADRDAPASRVLGELAGDFGPAERFDLVGLVEEIFFQVRFNF